MSSPIDPLAQGSAPVPSAVPANGQASEDQVRLLAEQIINAGKLPFEPGTYAKGVIQGIDEGSATVAPTVSLLLSGDTGTVIAGVRFLATYSPTVGDTVLIIKLGDELLAMAQYARRDSSATISSTEGGWIQATLSSGNGHNGNSNGNVMYRRVMDNGAWKMQWKGGLTFGGSTSILNAPLDAMYCPATKQSAHSPRSVVTQGGVSVGIDFLNNGTVVIVGAQWTTTQVSSASSAASPGGSTGEADGTTTPLSSGVNNNPGGAGQHDHLIGHTHPDIFVDSHTHNLNGHQHTANAPDWISFSGVEYFLG